MLQRLLRRGMAHVLASQVLMQGVGFVVLLVLPRLVDTAGYGSIRVLQSIVDVLVVIGGLGLGTALLSHDTRPPSGAADYSLLRIALRGAARASLAVTLVAVLLAASGILPLSTDVRAWLPWLALSVPFLAAQQVVVAFLQARSRLPEMARLQASTRLLSAVAVVSCTAAWGLPGFVAGSVLASAAVALAHLGQVGRGWHLAPSPRDAPPGFVRSARHGLSANLMQIAGRYADLLLIAVFVPDTTRTGQYALAGVLALPILVWSASVQAAAIPELAALTGSGSSTRRAVLRMQVEATAVATVVAVALLLVAPELVHAVYGPSWRGFSDFLPPLLAVAVLRSAVVVPSAAHIAAARTGRNVAASALSLALGAGLGAAALATGNLVTLAWAQAIGSALMVAAYAVLFLGATRSREPERTPDG